MHITLAKLVACCVGAAAITTAAVVPLTRHLYHPRPPAGLVAGTSARAALGRGAASSVHVCDAVGPLSAVESGRPGAASAAPSPADAALADDAPPLFYVPLDTPAIGPIDLAAASTALADIPRAQNGLGRTPTRPIDVPEPMSVVLLGAGAVGVFLSRRRCVDHALRLGSILRRRFTSKP